MSFPTTISQFPPITDNAREQELSKQLLFCPADAAAINENVLYSDGLFLYKQKDLSPVQVEDLKHSLSLTSFKWKFATLGMEIELLIEPMHAEDMYQATFNVISINSNRVNPSTFILLGLHVHPVDIGRESVFCFNYLHAKEIMSRYEGKRIASGNSKSFGPLWKTDAHVITFLPQNVVLYMHSTYGEKLTGPPYLASKMLRRKDGLFHRNPLSMSAPATEETVEHLKEQRNKMARESKNLKITSPNGNNFRLSLENTISHSRLVEKSLRPNNQGMFTLRFNNFTSDKPKTIQVNCDSSNASVNIIDQLCHWKRIVPIQLSSTQALMRAKDLASELRADKFYWALVQLAGVLMPLDKPYEPNQFCDLTFDILKGGQIDKLISSCRVDGEKTKLIGHMILFSALTFVAYETGGIQNLPRQLFRMSPEATVLLVQMKDELESSILYNKTDQLLTDLN